MVSGVDGSKGIVVAGTHSGSGKTTVTLGLMAALSRRGLAVQPFKCGPDFIDPTLHRLATGRVSRNLDCWMSGLPFVRDCFARHGAGSDIAVVEGVMGCFDGGESSSGALAKALGLPVVLVVDVRSMAESVAAVVNGFETLDPQMRLAGVIFNRVGSPRHLELLTSAVKEHCRAEVLGYLPRDTEFTIPDRHLGLHMGEEAPISEEALNKLAATVEQHIDLDRLVELAAGVSDLVSKPAATIEKVKKVKIGIARDRAFCFYYQDNLDLLQAAGAELVEFSPLADEKLPAGLDGIYLGGGYPELYAAQLSANSLMRAAIREWSEAGKPLYAECGGFMYLTDGIVDLEGNEHPMAGVYPVKSRMKKGRTSLGYREATTTAPTFFGEAGTVLRGHEFHYSAIDPMPESVERAYRLTDGSLEGYKINNTLGGYLHLHFGFDVEVVASFVKTCRL
ncbi:MAG: cobyrinate a,c-diamide synthase [Desulfobulbaceae bacterium]|nr:cobyrinate a,c-diamide synthase [Desulfobulbaceae bacterium]